MAELVFSAADTAQLLRPQASIKRAATAVTAFIGRALKGPVSQPVAISSFNDYQRVFGGLWQHSVDSCRAVGVGSHLGHYEHRSLRHRSSVLALDKR